MNSQPLWQVAAEGRLYEATFDEVLQWISEGALLPEDMVRHGNLRWLEAGKVPVLHEHFLEFERKQLEPKVDLTEVYTNFQVKEFESDNRPPSRVSSYSLSSAQNHDEFSAEEIPVGAGDDESKYCYFHPETEPYYYCGACLHCFCKTCPNSYGTVKLCPLCGGLCEPYQSGMDIHSTHGAINKPYKRVKAVAEAPEPVEVGLSLRDMLRSFLFPFKFPIGFLVQLLLFMTLGIGIGGILIGNTLMFAVGLISTALVITLQFGEFSKTLENITQNNVHSSFMPHINKYSVVEDFVHPFFMGFSVYLISFGLFFIIGAATLILVNLNFSNNLQLTETEIREKNHELNEIIRAKKGSSNETATADPAEVPRNVEQFIDLSKENQSAAVFGDNYFGDNGELNRLIESVMRLSIYFQMPLFFSFILGVIYFPVGCAVAGSSRSITKILNPLVGLKAMRKLGFDFIKILSLFLGFTLLSIGLAVATFIGFSYLSHPTVGLLLTIAVGSFLPSYFWLVYSNFLGTSVSRKLVTDREMYQIDNEAGLRAFI